MVSALNRWKPASIRHFICLMFLDSGAPDSLKMNQAWLVAPSHAHERVNNDVSKESLGRFGRSD